MKKWEYLIKENCSKSTLYEAGRNGWELVSVICLAGGANNLIFYFKREITE